jgi:hypothetical protein
VCLMCDRLHLHGLTLSSTNLPIFFLREKQTRITYSNFNTLKRNLARLKRSADRNCQVSSTKCWSRRSQARVNLHPMLRLFSTRPTLGSRSLTAFVTSIFKKSLNFRFFRCTSFFLVRIPCRQLLFFFFYFYFISGGELIFIGNRFQNRVANIEVIDP